MHGRSPIKQHISQVTFVIIQDFAPFACCFHLILLLLYTFIYDNRDFGLANNCGADAVPF